MQSVNCYNCGSNASTPYATENGFALVKCSGCGLLFVNPRPDDHEIEQAHKQGTHRGVSDLKMTGRFSPLKIRRYLRVLGDLFESGSTLNAKSWLDIGCGHGEFLVALRKFSNGQVVAKGTEPNVLKLASARRRGLDVSYIDLERHSEQYDVISLLNVYSHLPDPPASLASWKRLLKPHGELLLETGDTAHLSGIDHYRPFYLPDHLSFASESIVTSILERSGFQILQVRKYTPYTLDLMSLMKETAKLFLPNYRSRVAWIMKSRRYVNTDMFVRAAARRDEGI
jgi:SAM-dependent methyltransferase